jgi:predicted SAM-dependent methyltransferase
MFHALEHIEEKFWPQIFLEFHRVLIPEGQLLLAYPEWKICAQNYLENKYGHRSFWKATLYGLQRYPGDYHVSIVNSLELVIKLESWGFKDIRYKPEVNESYNTFLIALKNKDFKGIRTHEDVVREEIFDTFLADVRAREERGY